MFKALKLLRNTASAGAAAVALLAGSAGAWAEGVPETGAEAPRRVLRDLGPVVQAAPFWVEHHGSFRFRPELLVGGDLGAGTSPVPSPLAASTGDDADAQTLSWASVRLRYEPTLHLGRSLEIHLGLDALDNLVLGSTHERSGGLVADDLLSDAAASASAGEGTWRDALRVHSLYGRWLVADAIDLAVGRLPQHFGLGLSRNAGQCADCDFGSVVDGARAALTLSGFRVEASWEWTAVGATTAGPGELGQAVDLGQEDDVTTYTLQVGQRPVRAEELAARTVLLEQERGWGVDWAIFSSFTDQTLSSSEQLESTSLECRPMSVSPSGQQQQDVDCIQLYRRGASFWRPGAWVRAEHRPAPGSTLRLELEVAGLVGEIAHPQRLEVEDSKESKDFLAFGGALEVEYLTPSFSLGLDAGFATGDDGDFVGVLDGQNIVDPDDDAYGQNDNVRLNRTVTGFTFHRDYRLDLILFRQVLGAVTNAVYLKPWIAKDVLQLDDATLSLRLDVLYALAANPEGTPGDGSQWGVEVDGRVGLRFPSGLAFELAAGVLVPLDALDDAVTGASGDPAFAARGLATWSF